MRKHLLSLLLFIFVCKLSEAQQLHFTSVYQQHNAMYNPAAAGFTGHGLVGVTYRSMWEAFSGNPRTFMVYGDTYWEKKSSGFAGYLYKDVTGPTSRTGVQLAYSYHVKTGAHSQLGLGLEFRGLQYAVDVSKISSSLDNDPVITGVGSGNSLKSLKLDAGAGIYFSDGKFSAGAAVSQLIQSKLAFNEVQNATLRAKLYRHFAFTASYLIETGGTTHLTPFTMVRYIPHAPTEYDFGCKVDLQDKIWFTLDWRPNHFWSLQAGLKLAESISLNYAYDIYPDPFSDFNSGGNAHEFGLRFDLKKKK